MTTTEANVTTYPLGLPEELVLTLLNEENGYFHQVPGWDLNCAIIGAVLAELSLQSRIDTDMTSLFLLDQTETGNPALDNTLKEIANEPTRRNAQYWIERLAPQAEHVIDLTLDRLVEMRILEYHDGEFWTMARNPGSADLFAGLSDVSGFQFVKTRISNAIFNNEIPDPRDSIIICLVNACDVFRFMFQLDDEAEERIAFLCNLDLIGRSIAAAVSQNIAGALFRRSALAKRIPTVSLGRLILNPHLRDGNVPALLADLAKEYGPVFQIRPPFSKPMIFIAGPDANQWVHRRGRMYLRTKDYFSDFERVYGASGVLPSLDGADHFRLRKSLSAAYSRGRLAGQLDQVYFQARKFMSEWETGESYPARNLCRQMINAQLSRLFVSVESQDIFDDLSIYKERALVTHVIKALPKFMLKTPGMRRRAKTVDVLLDRVQGVHTPAQRADSPRDLADDILSLHASDPQFVPESNLRFALAAALIASVYLGDAFSFTLYAMASQPELYERIQAEADALFANGDPSGDDLNPSTIDVTHRFLMECLRMYPIVPVSIRNVMNSCVVEDFELPVGTRLYIAQTASHFMEDVFPEPTKFDIDRYLPPRNEHLSPGYAPYGLGTHTCLGSRWMELQLALNVLMVAHYFNIKVSPNDYKLKYSPIPSMKPNKKLKFLIAEKRHELKF
ncbi:MAG: cytochrome P450 [Chloroflexota bacterium]|nr:cytochrome P450 [Chloroflexota bacterium]